MLELEHPDYLCENQSRQRGVWERAHLTLRIVWSKSCTVTGHLFNGGCKMTSLEAYMADYNRRFGKVPRHDFDVHRAVENMMRTWGLFSLFVKNVKVSKSLTIQYDKMLYLIEDSEPSRRCNKLNISMYHHPDGRKEPPERYRYFLLYLRPTVRKSTGGAIVDNKRLSPNRVYTSAEQAG